MALSMLSSLRAGVKLYKYSSRLAQTSLSFQNQLSESTSHQHTLKDSFLEATGSKTARTVICRTSVSDPSLHSQADHGLFYTVPEPEYQQWLSKSLSKEYRDFSNAFEERAIMVREPALEILECLKASNYELPVNRYVLFGREGCGKSTTLSHVMHYCGTQGWLLVHVPWGAHFNRYCREFQPSATLPEYFDQPLESIDWLSYFKKINGPRLKELDLKLTSRYVWNKRESSEVGSSLLDALEFGIARSKYATDVIGLVLRELKTQASSNGFNVLMAVDGVNAFWETTRMKREDDKTVIEAEKLSLVNYFTDMLKNDWAGGAVVCTVDISASSNYKDKAVYMPRILLQKKGFEFFDPFIPIHVPDYSDKEAYSCVDYFLDRRWIQNPKGETDEGKEEIIHLSAKNPRELYVVTRVW